MVFNSPSRNQLCAHCFCFVFDGILRKIYCKGKPFPLVNIDHRDWKKGPTITKQWHSQQSFHSLFFCVAEARRKDKIFNGQSKKQAIRRSRQVKVKKGGKKAAKRKQK